MTIKQNGGVFGRNPTFNDVTIEGQLTFDGDIDINSDLKISGDLDVTGSTTLALPVGIGAPAVYDMTLSDTAGSAIFNIKSNPASYAAVFFGDSDIPNIGRLVYQNSDNAFQFWTSGSQKIEINALGNLKFTNSGNGIDFSATSGTGTSELLDDYEEGTWTPTLPNGGTLSVSGGTYTKVGRLVSVRAFIQSISPTANTSQFRIGGLPFTTDNTAQSYGAGSISYSSSFDASGLGLLNSTNGTHLFFHYIDGTSGNALSNNNWISSIHPTNGALIFQISYFAI